MRKRNGDYGFMNEIYVVGLGPGKEEMMTGEAIRALDNADTIIGR